jgi:aminoglycoside phosphotransferase (APT) family kinase protein
VIDAAWLRARPDARAMVLDRTRALLSELRGAPVPRCAVHGDFWRGNIARTGGQLRIFDWEWASLHGAPMFDLWTYELAELRVRAAAGDDDLAAPVRDALERVAAELSRRSLPTELAPATLPAVLARLAFRIHGATGFEDRMEKPSARVMASVEDVLRNTA